MHVSRGLATQLVLRSPLVMTGALCLFISQIFAWVFLPMTDVPGLWEWRGPVETTRGQVVSVNRTGTRINKRRVLKFNFEHGPHRGASYSTSSSATHLHAGSEVELEYPKGKPEGARIVGMSRKAFPPWTLLALTPAVLAGLVLFIVGVVLGRRRVGIVERGQLGAGDLVERKPTNTRVNRQRVHLHRYRFTAGDGRTGEATGRSHHRLPDKADIIYDPETLRAVVVSALPGRPHIDDGGELAAAPSRLVFFVAAAPVLGLAGWVLAVLVSLR